MANSWLGYTPITFSDEDNNKLDLAACFAVSSAVVWALATFLDLDAQIS